jgi:serine protease
MQECDRQGAKVITMSLGGAGTSISERTTIDQLFFGGVVLVAASGNSGDSDNPLEYPAGYDNVISVGAADANKRIASFSSFNDQVSLVAPGVGITSLGTASNDAYTSLSGAHHFCRLLSFVQFGRLIVSFNVLRFCVFPGTSMACPHVAGVAALLFSIFENASSQQVSDALFNSAQGLGQCGKNVKFGHGHVDAKAAADLLQSDILPQAICEEAVVTIKPDQYGSETTWLITNPLGVSVAGGGPYQDGNQDHEVTLVNLPQLMSGECYTFTIFDSSGDG